MRALSHQLHSSRLDLVGLVPALSGLCQEITKKYEIDVHFDTHEVPPNLTKDVQLCLFRVAQEALETSRSIAMPKVHKSNLGVSGTPTASCLAMPAEGFNPAATDQGSGIGLISMRERLRLVGGKFSVVSEPMRGTEVRAEIPLSVAVHGNR